MSNHPVAVNASNKNIALTKLTALFSAISLLALLTLHILSPEFSPSWRMVSEYANGRFEWVLVIFFMSWGIGTWCLALLVWRLVTSIAGKAGAILLFISGLGEILAAFFNVNHPQHGTAGALGVPTFIIGTLLVSWNLQKQPGWIERKRKLMLSANANWISLLFVIVTMVLMIAGFKNAGIAIGPGQQPPKEVPAGVIALVGYANRILIFAFIYWLLFVSRSYRIIASRQAQSLTGNTINEAAV